MVHGQSSGDDRVAVQKRVKCAEKQFGVHENVSCVNASKVSTVHPRQARPYVHQFERFYER